MSKSLPPGLKWRSSSRYILTTVAIGRFTDILIFSLMIPVFPFFLHDRLDLPPNEIQSHVSALLATFSAATLISSIPAGYLADLLPTRRAPYMLGLILLLISTVLFAAATNFTVLIVARAVQGMSAALVNAVGMAMVVDTVGSNNLGESLGTLYTIISVAELSAPAMGGILYATRGYQGVFGVSMSAIVLDLIMRLFLIEKKVAASYLSNKSSEGDPNIKAAGGVLNRGRLESEGLLTEEDPLLPSHESSKSTSIPILHCLRSSRLLVALGMTFLQAFIFGTYDATLVPEAQSRFGFTSFEAGLLFIPLGLPNLLLAPVIGKAVDKHGTKIVATIGFGFLGLCFTLFRLPWDRITDMHTQIAIQGLILLLQGIFGTMIGVPSVVEATHAMEDFTRENPSLCGVNNLYGQLFGLSALVFNAGLTAGPMCGGFLREQIGYGNLYMILAGDCAVACICAFVFIGRRRGDIDL